jgi:hypothetical protein
VLILYIPSYLHVAEDGDLSMEHEGRMVHVYGWLTILYNLSAYIGTYD